MNKTSWYRTSTKKVKAEFVTYHQPHCCFVVCLFVFPIFPMGPGLKLLVNGWAGKQSHRRHGFFTQSSKHTLKTTLRWFVGDS